MGELRGRPEGMQFAEFALTFSFSLIFKPTHNIRFHALILVSNSLPSMVFSVLGNAAGEIGDCPAAIFKRRGRPSTSCKHVP